MLLSQHPPVRTTQAGRTAVSCSGVRRLGLGLRVGGTVMTVTRMMPLGVSLTGRLPRFAPPGLRLWIMMPLLGAHWQYRDRDGSASLRAPGARWPCRSRTKGSTRRRSRPTGRARGPGSAAAGSLSSLSGRLNAATGNWYRLGLGSESTATATPSHCQCRPVAAVAPGPLALALAGASGTGGLPAQAASATGSGPGSDGHGPGHWHTGSGSDGHGPGHTAPRPLAP